MKFILSVVFSIFIISSVMINAYAQTPNINQVLNEQYINNAGCNLVNIPNTQAFLPYSIKIAHDPKSQINVTTTSSVGSQVLTDGNNPSFYIINTNSTDNNIAVHISIDYKTAFNPLEQNNVWVEYWSAGSVDHIEKNVLTSGTWCEDIQLATLPKPTPPNIPQLVQDAVQKLYDKTLAVVDANTKASINNAFLNWLTVLLILSIMGFQGLSKLRGRKKKKSSEKNFDESIKQMKLSVANNKIAMKHTDTMMEMKFDQINTEMRNRFDSMLAMITINMNSAIVELKKISENKIVVKEEPEQKPEESKIKENVGEPSEIKKDEVKEEVKIESGQVIESKPDSSNISKPKIDIDENVFGSAMDSAESGSLFDKIKTKIPFQKKDIVDKSNLSDNEKDEIIINQYVNEYYNIKKDGRLDVERLQKMYDEWHDEYSRIKTMESARRIKALYRVLYGVVS